MCVSVAVFLCLSQDPVCTPKGHLFSREAILENLLEQKKVGRLGNMMCVNRMLCTGQVQGWFAARDLAAGPWCSCSSACC